MRSARPSLLAAAALSLGLGTVGSIAPAAHQRTADVASAHTPGLPGNPMLAPADAPLASHDRRRWLRSRRTSPSYRSLRKSTGTHKQNRRRQLAGNP